MCRFCGCTAADACSGGCDWVDAAEDLCTTCEVASRAARIMLVALAQRPSISIAADWSRPETWTALPADDQTVLVMLARSVADVVAHPVQADLDQLTTELNGLLAYLDARYPAYMAEARARQTSMREIFVDLLEGRGRVVLVGG